MLTITLSGPKTSESQARNALVAERFDNSPPDHDYGLPPASDQQAESFITVHGEDVDKAWDAVRSLGWQLRVHHEKPEPAKHGPEDRQADKIAELESRLSRLELLGLPPIGGGAVESPPWAEQNTTLGAEQFRRGVGSLLQRGASIGSITGGIVGSGDCALTPPGSGMSVNTAPGEVWVPGTTAATQSGYYCRVSSSTNLAVAASDPTNPRVDREAAVVTDSAYAGGTNTFALAIVTGTPTSGATLVNLNGVGAAPASSYTLGYVLVPATSTNVTGGNILNVAAFVNLLRQQDTGWVALTLGTNVGTGGGYTPAARLVGTTVALCGVLKDTSGTLTIGAGATIATVPAGMAPASLIQFVSPFYSGSLQYNLQISAGGILTASSNIQPLNTFAIDGFVYRLS